MKIVRATLADGSVREYRYDRAPRAPRTGGALRFLFNLYSVSPEFRQMQPGSQEAYLRNMNALEEDLGWMTLAQLQDKRARIEFYAVRDALVGEPYKADFRIGVLRSALAWAEDRGHIDINRARRIGALVQGSKHQEKCYTLEQEAEILSRPQHIRDLYTVALYTCLRRVDCSLLGDEHMKDPGWFVIQPRKTAHSSGVIVHLPYYALPPLAAAVARLRNANPKGPLLRTETGIPWQPHNISVMWRREVDELEFEGMRFHDIRHTGDTRLVMAGCTEAERGAINGDQMAEGSGQVYVARMREISVNAYRKWAAYLVRKPEVVALEKRRGKRAEKTA